ncbi:MAG: cell division protein ZapB [Cyanobacteria bacterium J06633_2]
MGNLPFEVLDLTGTGNEQKSLEKMKALGNIKGNGTQTAASLLNATPKGFGSGGKPMVTKSVPQSPGNESTSIDVNNSSTATEEAESNADSNDESGSDQDSAAALSVDQVRSLIDQTVAPLAQRVTALTTENSSLQSQLDTANAELETERQKATQAEELNRIIQDIGKMGGIKPDAAMVSTATSARSDRMSGALKDWWNLADSCQSYDRATKNGMFFTTRDALTMRSFVRANKEQLIADTERWAKANGLLKGSGGSIRFAKDSTTIADVVGGFLPVLSSIMRETHRSTYIFHQFAVVKVDPERGLGNVIQVPRAAFQPGPTTSDERRLSGGGVYKQIDSGNQNISTGTVSSEVEEWGLGANPSAPPIGITKFVQAYSMIELMAILERNLMQDYMRWEDLKHQELWRPTSRVVYNDKNRVTTSASDLAANDGGTCTYQFLQALSDYMFEQEMTPLSDGCFGYAAPVAHVTQLRNSIDGKISIDDVRDIDQITSVLKTHSTGWVDKVTGYLGLIGNMHVFAGNNHSKGAAGQPGVQSETIASAPRVTRSGYAFGGSTIGRGIGSPVEIRFDDNTNFGRMNRAIWHEESSFVAMDVDPVGYNDTSAVPQQTRVVEVRCLDEEI